MFNHMPLQTALALNPQPAGLRKEGEQDVETDANEQHHVGAG